MYKINPKRFIANETLQADTCFDLVNLTKEIYSLIKSFRFQGIIQIKWINKILDSS